MLFDDNGHCEDIFAANPAFCAGPGGFRASGEGMSRVMDHVEKEAKSLGAVIHYETEAITVRQSENRNWIVQVRLRSGLSSQTFDKIVIATGAFSRPAVPAFAVPFIQPFRTPVRPEEMKRRIAIHTSHLSDHTVQEALNCTRRHIVIVGASKSALDASERFSSLGHSVTLVIRNPPYLAPPALLSAEGPKDAVAMVGTREKAIGVPFPPDVVSGQSASGGLWARVYRWLVHSSWLSSRLHAQIISRSVAGFARWGRWADSALRPMIPTVGLMWSEFSIFPGPEQFANLVHSGDIAIVKGAVVDMIESSTEGKEGFELVVQGDNAEPIVLFATSVIFGTGWSTGEYPFFDDAESNRLGLPMPVKESRPEREEQYEQLDRSSMRTILNTLRTMRIMPSDWSLNGFAARFGPGKPPAWAPYRLFRLMVPLSSLYDRDIVFAGVPTCKANHVLFTCQAHWIADYFLDLLPHLPTLSVARREISTQTVWAQRLFGPSHGRLGQWLGAMWIEYCSRLCWDMGVQDDGKGWRGVVRSDSYDLDNKRRMRDEAIVREYSSEMRP
ncbi:hypothetical protein IAR55_003032 [Kwoniella newhampshirensis]|uniref:FAD/NAD(P)-binding domain-containing protein n=1 Tax=Kwoniella newhampshirensis TaxID=1651941 RepID=A0AAW0YPK4_9TREE